VSTDAEHVDRVCAILREDASMLRWGGVIMLGLGALLGVKGRGSVYSSSDAVLLVAFVGALIVPGLLLLRHALRDPRRDPLVHALALDPAQLEEVTVAYQPTDRGGHRAQISVWLRGRRSPIILSLPDDSDRALVGWIESRRSSAGRIHG
jgi:hypothetical protein